YSDYLFFVKPAVLHCSSSFFAAFAATGKFQLKMAQFRRARSKPPAENLPLQDGDHLTTQRVEAFSDGVFSIAITLLVLELAIPESRSPSPPPLEPALIALWPSYLTYVLSFLIIGIYWANHHYIFRFYKRTNHVFNLLNILFLLTISFLPFPTAVLSRYVEIEKYATTAVMFYAFALRLPAFAFFLMWAYASSRYRLIDRRLQPRFVQHLTRQYAASIVIYAGALCAAYFSYRLGLAICIILTFLYLLPSKRPEYRTHHEP
ncbi:MAG: TMEM175 family protein, partial [Acidobacteriota bacterium]|nr:TMEM175 family protein [Acidobacteriota bacterium]